MRTTIILPFAVSILFILASCSEVVTDFKEAAQLEQKIIQKYKVAKVKITLSNNQNLDVLFTNTKYNDSTAIQQQRIACEIGQIVLSEINREIPITAGRVSFVKKRNYGILKTSSAADFDMKLDSLSRLDSLQEY